MAEEVNVKQFGALGNGSTDDTAAIQKALDAAMNMTGGPLRGARVVFPQGQYRFTKQLNGYRPDNAFVSLDIAGVSNQTVKLVFQPTGPDQDAFKTSLFKYSKIRNMEIVSSGPYRGRRGLYLANNANSGTGTNSIIIDQVNVYNFSAGFHTGTTGSCSSEIIYLNCQATRCSTGFRAADYNALNHIYINSAAGECDNGFKADAGDSFHFIGGGFAANKVDFYFNTAGNFSISKLRSERSPIFAKAAIGGGKLILSIDDCMGQGTVDIQGFATLRLNSSLIYKVIAAGSQMSLLMDNCGIADVLPYNVPTGATKPNAWVRGCYQMAGPNPPGGSAQVKRFPDEIPGKSLSITDLPTAKPTTAKQLWNDGGTLKIS